MSKYKHQLSLEKITNKKKGTVVWPSQITVCRVKIQTPTITGKNYSQEKKVQLSGLRPEKITTGKKVQSYLTITNSMTLKVLGFLLPPKQSGVLECHHISYFKKWKLWAMVCVCVCCVLCFVLQLTTRWLYLFSVCNVFWHDRRLSEIYFNHRPDDCILFSGHNFFWL